jgi:hypothetical protein
MEILNDRDFIEFELKKHLIPIENLRTADTKRQSDIPSNNRSPENKPNFYRLDDRLESGALHSMIGKDVMRSIK